MRLTIDVASVSTSCAVVCSSCAPESRIALAGLVEIPTYEVHTDARDLDAGGVGGESRESATAKHVIGQWLASVDHLKTPEMTKPIFLASPLLVSVCALTSIPIPHGGA